MQAGIKRVALLALISVVPLLAQTSGFDWHIPKPFPRPSVPADNPMSAAKVESGRYLFYEKRMSVNGKESCGSCHRQELAFTDGRARAEGTTGELHPRSSMSLANVAYSPLLTWAHPSLSSLEEQALLPIFGTEPIELGLKGYEDRFLSEIGRDPLYQKLFRQAYPGQDSPFTMSNVTKSIAAFERTLISVNSPYDRYRYANDSNAISEAAKRGEILFFPVNERAASSATAAGTSMGLYNMKVVVRRRSRFKTPDCTTFVGSFHTRLRTRVSTNTRIVVRTSASSGRRRCATSP